MKDNFDSSFPVGDRYAGVRMQQGEVQQDADWNESASLAARQTIREVASTFDSVADLAARADTLVHSPALGDDLGTAADGVFRFEAGTGALRFGDGARGVAPATGIAVSNASREGAGRAGNVAMVQPFPIELTAAGNAADLGTQMLETFAAIADKLSAAQDRLAEEAYIPSAGRNEGDAGGGEVRNPIGKLAALLRDLRSQADSFARRLERARSDNPPSRDDD